MTAASKSLHVIPVGGKEPVHECNFNCWCFPIFENGVIVHNAKDVREAQERQGKVSKDKKWAVVKS